MTYFRSRAFGALPAGDTWIVTLHSSGSQAVTAVETAWEAAVENFWSGALGALLPTGVTLTGYATDQLDPTTGKNVAQATGSSSSKGSGTGAVLPQRVAIVVGVRTALPTRAGRGRQYWPSPDAGALSADGLLASTDAQSLATSWAGQLSTMSATSQPVVYHAASRTGTPITEVTVGVVLGQQRRRTNKVANSYASAQV